MFILGLTWSAACSMVVGASFYSTQKLFIISRALQGLGAALTLPTGLALIGATSPTGVRKRILFTLYAAMSPIGLMVGALGASILTLAWWSWAYWAFSVILLVLGTVAYFTIPSTPQTTSPQSGARAFILDLDAPGMMAGIASLGLFGFVWNQAQTVGWRQPYLWTGLVTSVILAALFVMIEAYYAPKPLIPHSALSPEVSWTLVALGCGWSSFGIWIFYGWQFVEILRHASPLVVSYLSPRNEFDSLNILKTEHYILHPYHDNRLPSLSEYRICVPSGRPAYGILYRLVDNNGGGCSHRNNANQADVLEATVDEYTVHGMGHIYKRPCGYPDAPGRSRQKSSQRRNEPDKYGYLLRHGTGSGSRGYGRE
jgi:hypothetical protein